MKKLTGTLLFCFLLVKSFSQFNNKINSYLQAQYLHTTHDITKGNNPWGAGVAAILFYKNKTKLTPVIDIGASIFLEDDKVGRLDTTGTLIESVSAIVNTFVGVAYQPEQHVYVSFVGGPALINGQVLLGIQPSIGFYFSKKQRSTVAFSYTKLYNRYKPTGADYQCFKISMGFKLF